VKKFLSLFVLHQTTRDELDNAESNDKRPRRLYEKMKMYLLDIFD